MMNLVILMLFLPLIGCFFAVMAKKNEVNAFNVAFFTLVTNILVILRLFSQIDIKNMAIQFVSTFVWLEAPNIKITFGVDAFSLTVLLGIYIALIIGLVGIDENNRKKKSLMLLTLYFAWNITGFFVAGDVISFYVFFAGMLLPLIMLVGAFGNFKKSLPLYRFFIYYFIGIICLLISTLLLFKFYNGNMLLSEIAFVDMSKNMGLFVWTCACLAFLSRIPVWPFHYWISSISANIKNPLVYIITNIMPLAGLYGFIRFWPLSVPESIEFYLPYVEVFGIVTMLFIALIGYVNKEFLYNLFAYSTVYYLLFLLAIILPTNIMIMNIAYSLFIFLIVVASLTVLNFQMEEQCTENKCEYRGILAYMPKLSMIIMFFILSAIGLPISSLFWNNFVLISLIFKQNFAIGVGVMMAISLVAVMMLNELYVMRDLHGHLEKKIEVEDISRNKLIFLVGIMVIMFLSFFNPLWFIF